MYIYGAITAREQPSHVRRNANDDTGDYVIVGNEKFATSGTRVRAFARWKRIGRRCVELHAAVARVVFIVIPFESESSARP